MARLIKNGGEFVSVTGAKQQGGLKNPGFSPVMPAGMSNTTLRPGGTTKPTQFTGEQFGFVNEENLPELEMIEQIPLKSREELELEYQLLKQTYINEGERARDEAKAWAEKAIADAKKEVAQMYENAAAENEKMTAQLREETLKTAYDEGYENGFAEGNQKGYDEGYNKGLRKCKDTMKELVSLVEEIPRVKEEYFRQHEKDLFDCIFTIANKVTADSLKQKDKAVISKMLKQLSKEFRQSEYVKITLSKLDVEEMATVDLDSIRELFGKNQTIEFEVSKEAPAGTLILDNGREIADASVATQLKMIENLGKGKFRDMPESEDDED